MTAPSARPSVQTWERRTEIPLGIAALVFLGAYAWPILEPDLSTAELSFCRYLTWAVWAIFALEYAVRLTLASPKLAFLKRTVLDVLVIVLPILRPLRLLRLIMLVRIVNRGAMSNFRGRVAIYTVGAVGLIVFVASLAELDAERGQPGSNIETFGDALWWASTTVTTVGYGDRFPVTTTGRFVAVGLMVCGIALVGIITASLATWMLERIRAEETETRTDLEAIATQIEELRRLLDEGANTPPKSLSA